MRDFEDASYDYGLEPGESFDPAELEDEPFDLMQPHVMTALGPIDPGALGFTLPHAIVLRKPAPESDLDEQLDDPAAALLELEAFFLTGGRALVDLTTGDAGRDSAGLVWVAARAPLHLVVATGAVAHAGDELAATMIRELTEGIDGTAIKAGVIVMGRAPGERSEIQTRQVAAAAAHQASGAPVVLLDVPDHGTLTWLEGLRANGVAADRVVAGGLDVTSDESIVRELLATGALALFDCWGKSGVNNDLARAELIKRLVDAGFGAQLLISGDFPRRSERLAYGGDPGFVYFLDRVPLMLMAAGLTAMQVRQIFIENPASVLTVRRCNSKAGSCV